MRAIIVLLTLLLSSVALGAGPKPIVRESNGIHFFPDGIMIGPDGIITAAGIINVLQYALCDGVTDDTAAIRAAVAAAPSPGVVYFPPHATPCIVAPSGLGPMISIAKPNLAFIGAASDSFGDPATIKIKDSSLVGGIPGRVFANQDANGVVTDGSGLTISNIYVDGNDRNNPPATTPFEPEIIECQDCTNVRILQTRAIDVTARWLTLYRGSNILIDGNDLYMVGQSQNADPIQVNGADGVRIVNNVVGNTGEGIVFEHATGTSPAAGAGEATNGVIGNNIVVAYAANELCLANGKPFSCCTAYHTGDSAGFCAAGNPQGGAIIILASHVNVSDNLVINHNSINIEGGRGFDTYDIELSDNVQYGGTANGYGILNITGVHPNGDQPVHHIAIHGGRVTNTNAACVAFYSAALNAPHDILVDGLDCHTPNGDGVLFEAGGTGGSTQSAESIRAITIANMKIVGPCVGGGTCGGVRFKNNPSSPDFTDITLRDSLLADSGRYGIWMVGGQTRFNVARNTFRGNTNGSTNWASGTITNWLDNIDTDTQFVAAGSATTVNTVTDNNGVLFAAIDPAGAGTGANWWRDLSNGSKVYCTNCTQSEICATGGTGAQMRKINGLNHCASSPNCPGSIFTPLGSTGPAVPRNIQVPVPVTAGSAVCSRFMAPCNMAATKIGLRLTIGTGGDGAQCAMSLWNFNAGVPTKILDSGVQTCDTSATNINATGLTAGQLWAGQDYVACVAFSSIVTTQYQGLVSGDFFTLFNQHNIYGYTTAGGTAQFNKNCTASVTPYACCTGLGTGTCTGFGSSLGSLTTATPQTAIMAVAF